MSTQCKGSFKLMKTRIRLLVQPKSMSAIIDATQREQRHGLAWNWCVSRDAQPNKITPKWIYKANTKGPMSEARGPRIGGPGPPSYCSTVAIGPSNPYFSTVKYLHNRCCSIGTELNKASVLDEMWVLIRLWTQIRSNSPPTAMFCPPYVPQT